MFHDNKVWMDEEINDDDSFSTKKLLDFLHEKLQCYGTASEQKTDAVNNMSPPRSEAMKEN